MYGEEYGECVKVEHKGKILCLLLESCLFNSGLKLSQWKFSSEHLSDVKKGWEKVLIWDFGVSLRLQAF